MVSGLWSFPCICGSRLRTWRQPAFCKREHGGNDETLISFTERWWPKQEEEAECDWASYFFWWDVVRRVHRKAPTTTTMMVKAPTEMMMMMTRMWFSLPPTPDLPREEKDWIRLNACVSKFLRDTNRGTHHILIQQKIWNQTGRFQNAQRTSPTFIQSDHDLRVDGWEKLTNSIDRVLWWVSLRPMFWWNIWGWFKIERKHDPMKLKCFYNLFWCHIYFSEICYNLNISTSTNRFCQSCSPSSPQARRWKSLQREKHKVQSQQWKTKVWRGNLPWSLAILSEDSA